MRLVFVDTGALYALADRKDPAHGRAKRFLAGWDGSLVATDFIFAETMSLITKRLGKEVAIRFGEGIRNSRSFRVIETSPEVREEAWTLFAGQTDKDYDLIDCISFATMRSLRIREAFGFDRHFLQAGFALVPGLAPAPD